jgi:phosphoenolpyruvate-protein kinase (PTS system EI component)
VNAIASAWARSIRRLRTSCSIYLAAHDAKEDELTKSDAKAVRDLSIEAITKLTTALDLCKERGSQAEFEQARRADAHSIGHIHSEILSAIYAEYPELDHLK